MAFLTPTPTLRPSPSPPSSPATPLRNTLLRASHSPASPRVTNPVSRRAFLVTLASAAGSLVAAAPILPASAEEQQLEWKVVTKGSGPPAQLGDLVGIRFKASYNGVVFDDIFTSTDPYFYRAGSGAVLKGIDEVVLQMSVGDVFDVTVPGDKAFGKKGRRASAGKPSIPPNATVFYTVELSTIPGKDRELLEGLSEADIGSSL